MATVTFVMGATASGKTYFINNSFADKDVDIHNVYDYQQRAYDEAGFGDMVPFGASFRCLLKANEMHLEAIIESVKAGRDVVVEQTFFKAKRRISYIDKIREISDVRLEIYVMCPSDERWQKNIDERELDRSLKNLKKDQNEIEFPNPAEGFDAIYRVTDGDITLQMDPPDEEIVIRSRKELAVEKEEVQAEDEVNRKRKELLKSMNTRPFWHYCEVCGKKEFITAKEAFDKGWDYPPNIGRFGMLSPRTCGDCGIQDTLFFKVNDPENGALPIVVESLLTDEEKITWNRIKGEPESLLEEE